MKKVQLVDDLYACVFEDGSVFVGKIDEDGKSKGAGITMNNSLTSLNYGESDGNFDIDDNKNGLSYDNGDVLIVRDTKEFAFSKDNYFYAFDSDNKVISVNCNALVCPKTSIPLVEIGDFDPNDHRITKGTVVSSCGGIKVGVFDTTVDDYTITKGLCVSREWKEFVESPDCSCAPLVSVGEFTCSQADSNGDIVEYEKITKGVVVRACGAMDVGMFSKAKDTLRLGMRVHACNFFKDTFKVFSDVDIGMFDDDNFLKAGVMIEETFFTGVNKFSKTGRWINKTWLPQSANSNAFGEGGRPSTLMLGVFEKDPSTEYAGSLKGMMVKSNGTFRVGDFDFVNGDMRRGIEVTPDVVNFEGGCEPEIVRKNIKR